MNSASAFINYEAPYFTEENYIVERLNQRGCTLSITGNGYLQGVGSVEITLTATGSTCDEAAAELRSQIIAMQLRIK